MAYHNNLESLTFAAGADLRGQKYKIVELDGSGDAILPSGASGIGILQNIPNAGQAATVAVGGESKIIAGGTLAIGDRVAANSGGWGVAVSSGDTTPIEVIGTSLIAVASGGIGTVHINRQTIADVTSGSLVDALP